MDIQRQQAVRIQRYRTNHVPYAPFLHQRTVYEILFSHRKRNTLDPVDPPHNSGTGKPDERRSGNASSYLPYSSHAKAPPPYCPPNDTRSPEEKGTDRLSACPGLLSSAKRNSFSASSINVNPYPVQSRAATADTRFPRSDTRPSIRSRRSGTIPGNDVSRKRGPLARDTPFP